MRREFEKFIENLLKEGIAEQKILDTLKDGKLDARSFGKIVRNSLGNKFVSKQPKLKNFKPIDLADYTLVIINIILLTQGVVRIPRWNLDAINFPNNKCDDLYLIETEDNLLLVDTQGYDYAKYAVLLGKKSSVVSKAKEAFNKYSAE